MSAGETNEKPDVKMDEKSTLELELELDDLRFEFRGLREEFEKQKVEHENDVSAVSLVSSLPKRETAQPSRLLQLEERVRHLEILAENIPQFQRVVLQKGDRKLGRNPTLMLCNNCEQEVLTETKHKIGQGTCFVAVVLLLFTGIGVFFPFNIKRCKDVAHKCPKCETTIDVRYVF